MFCRAQAAACAAYDGFLPGRIDEAFATELALQQADFRKILRQDQRETGEDQRKDSETLEQRQRARGADWLDYKL